MDLQQLILTRRTVHNYTAEKVSDALVQQALNLGLYAPNHKMTYPWVLVQIGPEARGRLADLSVELKRAKDPAPISDVKVEAMRQNVLRPSHLIALGIQRSADAGRQHEDYATLACSVQIASLFLWENGVATKWSTGGYSMHTKTYEILGLDAKAVSLEGCLMIGKAEVMPKTPERPGLERFLHQVV